MAQKDVEKGPQISAATKYERQRSDSPPDSGPKSPLGWKCPLHCIVVAFIVVFLFAAACFIYNQFPPPERIRGGCDSAGELTHQAYKLFGTKTTYNTAHSLLIGLARSFKFENRPADSLEAIEFDASNVNIPEKFFYKDSLQTLHQELSQAPYNCRIKDVVLLSRHAARMPDREDIVEIGVRLAQVIERIDLSKFAKVNAAPNGNADDNSLDNSAMQNSTDCSDPMKKYKNWKNFMEPEQGNMVLDAGLNETRAIAARFRSLYPEIFDGSQSDIQIGVTRKIRTAQTALPFLELLSNHNLKTCAPGEFSVDSSKPREIKDDRCFKQMIQDYEYDRLSFDEKCAVTQEKNLGLKRMPALETIAAEVSQKLKLANVISGDEVKSIYDMCRYESAYSGKQSIWCNLFTDQHLKFFEFATDADHYLNQGLGELDSSSKSACEITKTLIGRYKDYRNGLNGANSKRSATFWFSHSQVLSRVMALMMDFGDERSTVYSDSTIMKTLKDYTLVPDYRQFRTSLLVPFSANIAFSLYDCSNHQHDLFPKNALLKFGGGNEPNMTLVASINERPVKLSGCEDRVACGIGLILDSKLNEIRQCAKENYCKGATKYT